MVEYGSPILPSNPEWVDKIEKQKRILQNGTNEVDWKQVGTSKGFQYYQPRESPNSLKNLVGMAEGEFECSAELVLRLVLDPNVNKDLDGNIESIDLLDQLDAHNKIVHIQMKSMYFSAPRDACTFEHWQVSPDDGVIYKLCFPVEHEKAPRHPDESVRCRAFAHSGCCIIPDKVDRNRCLVRIWVDIDPRIDTVPQWIQKSFASKALAINAQTIATNMKSLHATAKKRRELGVVKIAVNHNGRCEPEVKQITSDKKEENLAEFPLLDFCIALFVATSYTVAITLA